MLPAATVVGVDIDKMGRSVRTELAHMRQSGAQLLARNVTDHADFENVMSDRLMRQAVGCINNGRRC